MNWFRRAAGFFMLAACLFLAGHIAVDAITRRARASALGALGAADMPLAAIRPRPLSGNPEGINLNTAAREELMALPGMSGSLADALIAQRGLMPFHFVEDLDIVRGIGEKRLGMLVQHGYVGEGP